MKLSTLDMCNASNRSLGHCFGTGWLSAVKILLWMPEASKKKECNVPKAFCAKLKARGFKAEVETL